MARKGKLADKAMETVRQFDDLPDSMLVNIYVIRILADRSLASLWRDIEAGRLAKPIKVGGNTARWRVEDVRKFLGGQMTKEIKLFKQLVSEISIKRYSQEEFVEIVEAIYKEIFNG